MIKVINMINQYLNNNHFYHFQSQHNGNETNQINNVCNNCGKIGHSFYQCKLPIISYGIILFKKGTVNANSNSDAEKKDYEFLMIRRKDSFGYIDLIRGKYSPYHIEQVQGIINEMSLSEKEKILNHDFKYLWTSMWGSTCNSQYKNEEIHSAKKFEVLKNGFFITPSGNENDLDSLSFSDKSHKERNYVWSNEESIKGEKEKEKEKGRFITLKDFVNESTSEWKETEWEFPKGRRNQKEKDLECALREFEEETGISKQHICIIENILPFEETFIGTNYKSYKHKYFLAFIKEQDDLNNQPFVHFQPSEVSKMEWKTLDQCLESIRPYHLEKKQLIQNVYKVLKEYRLFII